MFRSETSAEAPQDSEFLSLLRISEFIGFQWQTFGRKSEWFAESLADVAITRFLGCNFTQNFGRKVAKI